MHFCSSFEILSEIQCGVSREVVNGHDKNITSGRKTVYIIV
jgi:hypothetical protein